MTRLRCQFARERDRNNQKSRSLGRKPGRRYGFAAAPRADGAGPNKFQQKVTALTEPSPRGGKPLKNPSRHEL